VSRVGWKRLGDIASEARVAKLGEIASMAREVMKRRRAELATDTSKLRAENARLRAEAKKAGEERIQLRLAAGAAHADLSRIGQLAGQRDDEYPLKAAERVIAERDALAARIDELDARSLSAWRTHAAAITSELDAAEESVGDAMAVLP
jgi:hypothetical protein